VLFVQHVGYLYSDTSDIRIMMESYCIFRLLVAYIKVCWKLREL